MSSSKEVTYPFRTTSASSIKVKSFELQLYVDNSLLIAHIPESISPFNLLIPVEKEYFCRPSKSDTV